MYKYEYDILRDTGKVLARMSIEEAKDVQDLHVFNIVMRGNTRTGREMASLIVSTIKENADTFGDDGLPCITIAFPSMGLQVMTIQFVDVTDFKEYDYGFLFYDLYVTILGMRVDWCKHCSIPPYIERQTIPELIKEFRLFYQTRRDYVFDLEVGCTSV